MLGIPFIHVKGQRPNKVARGAQAQEAEGTESSPSDSDAPSQLAARMEQTMDFTACVRLQPFWGTVL